MKTIMIVDDEEKIRKTFEALLQNEGYKVFTAPGVLEANDILDAAHIDLIILDISMPLFEGKLLNEIRQAFYKSTKIIVSSVYCIDEQKKKIPDAEGYYDKTDGLSILMDKVKEILHEESKQYV